MNEAVRLNAKTNEIKKENSIIRQYDFNFSHYLKAPADQILFFQRTVGNQAVQSLMDLDMAEPANLCQSTDS